MNKVILAFAIALIVVSFAASQTPLSKLVNIIKAEDARRYDKTLEDLIEDRSEDIKIRAILAAGRIGDAKAVPRLAAMLENGSPKVREMTAFALGEIESINAADAILKAIKAETRAVANVPNVTARLIEAAGKIAAANPKDANAADLGKAILETLEAEFKLGSRQNRDVVLLGLTAALRAKPDKTDTVVANFLTHPDARVRSDAANTLTRIRAKNANETLRKMLAVDSDPVARANAARALGAAEDKGAIDLLIVAATEDKDSRVRVSAIRSLAGLKDPRAAEPLLVRGEELFESYKKVNKPSFIPVEQNEFIEVAAALGRILANTDNERADRLLADFGKLDKGRSPEVYIARVRIGPKRGDGSAQELTNWRQYSTLAQIVGEFASLEPKSETGQEMKKEAPGILRPLVKSFAEADPAVEGERMKAGPAVLEAYARFKTDDFAEIARTALKNKDVQMRATAANLLGNLPESKVNTDALEAALNYSLMNDIDSNDAQLAILDALGKFNKLYIVRQADVTLNAPDYLVRKKTADVLKAKGVDHVPKMRPLDERVYPLRPYKAGNKSKQGVLLNTDADYRRALSRKNGSVQAVLLTEKGTFTIDLNPEEAPLTVDNFIKLARSNYFNGLEVHRVVPNFVMQDGDPRGDGNGGPGWSIRCEVNTIPFERGVVGMALSGKDTGGSQWFVTHAPQPHLDGGYTVFGRVNETGMKVVDNIVRSDRILSVKIIGR